LREKVAEGRMRGQQCHIKLLFPLTLALSLRERGSIQKSARTIAIVRALYLLLIERRA